MPEINFIHADGRVTKIDAPENHSIMEVAVENGIEEIEGRCGGSLACASCHCDIAQDWKQRVEAEDNEKTEEEIDILELSPNPVTEHSRLGCQIKITKTLDGLKVFLP